MSPVAQLLHLQLAGDLIAKSYSRNKPLTIVGLTVLVLGLMALIYVFVMPRVVRRASVWLAHFPIKAEPAAVQVGTGGNTVTKRIAARASALLRHFHMRS